MTGLDQNIGRAISIFYCKGNARFANHSTGNQRAKDVNVLRAFHVDITIRIFGTDGAVCGHIDGRTTAVCRRSAGRKCVAFHVHTTVEVQALFRSHKRLNVEEFIRLKCDLGTRTAGLYNASNNDFLIRSQGQRLVFAKADDLAGDEQAVALRIKVAIFVAPRQIMVWRCISDAREIGGFVEDVVARIIIGVFAPVWEFTGPENLPIVHLFFGRDYKVTRRRNRTTQQHSTLGFQINLTVQAGETQRIEQDARRLFNYCAIGRHLDIDIDRFLHALFGGECVAVGCRISNLHIGHSRTIQRKGPDTVRGCHGAKAAVGHDTRDIGINRGILDAHAHGSARVHRKHILGDHAHGGIVAFGKHA